MSSTTKRLKVLTIVILLIVLAVVIIGVSFTGVLLFGNDDDDTNDDEEVSPVETPFATIIEESDGKGRQYTDRLLLNPFFIRNIYYGTLLVLTENDPSLRSCFRKCFDRFFICPESDQREECEEEAMILRECPSPVDCTRQCLNECNPKELHYAKPGGSSVVCVDFRNAKAICP